ncbi:hypothetical protein, conserved [Trypanosoma brucei gambiense DAL972]|uniref:SPRY domain-containing protein n=1 Tax=Trypanosoma brucei gambiense (strain MHOM/CI/86/DAL972) TaxID=679716 RepID=D0A0R0_TRYB9|nr:hypothetical protein, conserved [Trypanosoma brucei gambiense DAL972]CBH16818.1 hypothetical protein, conserved [Trypanosoma brucei gambiense DAL972]|eukprot:XP_011779082.1 hypothetical protein, conserved [Trypanosoma brucei gambiense DAL972]
MTNAAALRPPVTLLWDARVSCSSQEKGKQDGSSPVLDSEPHIISLGELDVLSCSDEELELHLNGIRDLVQSRPDSWLKKKGGKGFSKRQLALIQDELVHYQGVLKQANEILSWLLCRLNDRISVLRRDESMLREYYESLERGTGIDEDYNMHKKDKFHRRLRESKRRTPIKRYSKELEFLTSRHTQLVQLLTTVESEERAYNVRGADEDTSRRSKLLSPEDTKIEEIYRDAAAAGGGKAVTLMRMRALQPLIRKEQELRFVPPLLASDVHSRLRKEIILPFSVRVLALKIEKGNIIGDKFVQWYINTVVDPLTMAQLVELVPREHLVTTTVRLAKVCDAYPQSRRAQPLPDISHVVLESVSEGRIDAFASLVLSTSATCTRALRDKDEEAIILFSAVITAQVEVIRRIISVGFYNTNALNVWLFLNPNNKCNYYKTYVHETTNNVKKYLSSLSRSSRDHLSTEGAEEDVIEMAQITLTQKWEEWDSSLLTGGLGASLRHFLNNRLLWKRNTSTPKPRSSASRGGRDSAAEGWERGHGMDVSLSVSFTPSLLNKLTSGDPTFSSLLSRRKFDRLPMSAPKCAVLPATSTPMLRRVDPWGYTPLETTGAHLLLVGDTSTVNAHVVRLPARRMTKWNEHVPNEPQDVRMQRDQMQTLIDSHGTRFYYEVHISLFFLINDVPLSPSPFEYTAAASENATSEGLPSQQRCTTYVGWCSEECVAAADGYSSNQPLGSDTSSIGISFDVVHRHRLDELTEEVILRPMKHAVGCTNTIEVANDGGEMQSASLIRMYFQSWNRTPDGADENGSVSDDAISFGESRTSWVYSGLGTFSSEGFSLEKPRQPSETVVPFVKLVGEGNEESATEEDDSDDIPRVIRNVFRLAGVPVYKSQSIVIGCHVDMTTRSASYTVNGVSLGTIFTALPSATGLRPAVSLQVSEEMKSILQGVNQSDSTVVRFVFDRHLLLSHHMELLEPGAVEIESTTRSSSLQDIKPLGGSEEVELIPGMGITKDALLFDEDMMQCAMVRLLTGAERGSCSDAFDDEELMKGGRESISLGTALRVRTSSIRALLNNPTPNEDLLFFPPVLLRRRSDESEKVASGITIIPEDAMLAPLCAALAMRQRIAAYQIVIHPLLDFETSNHIMLQQRRMAVLACSTLGYEEVLYVLLQRMAIHEVVALFSIKAPAAPQDSQPKLNRRFAIIPANSANKITSASTLQYFHYTPLHCALLEGHTNCAHLLLFYLNRALGKEYLRHALNVFSCGGETALVISSRVGYTDIAKRLLALGASPFLFDRVTRSNCLELACAGGSEEIALALLDTPDFHSPVAVNQAGSAPPLCWCALKNISALVRPLLENGADPNVTLDGPTPLFLAVMFESQEVALELLRYCESTANKTAPSANAYRAALRKRLGAPAARRPGGDELGDEGPLAMLDVDAMDPRTQCTALHLACENGQLAVVRALIAGGAQLNVQNKASFATPLHLAVESGHEKVALDIVEYAKNKLRRGHEVLDINAIDKSGDTVLHAAARKGMLSVIEYIMSQFSEEEVARIHKNHDFSKRPSPANVLAVNRQGHTPLLAAIHAHQEEAAQLIASLVPDYLANPGGAIVSGTCVAISESDVEGLDNVTLFLLSSPNYVATEDFRKRFFDHYNAKRAEMDLSEDYPNSEEVRRPRVALHVNKRHSKRRGRRVRVVPSFRKQRMSFRLSISSMYGVGRSRGSTSAVARDVRTEDSRSRWVVANEHLARSKMTRIAPRRCSMFVRMLLAKGYRNPTTRKTIQFLKQGFAIDELYAMLDVISFETLRKAQSHWSMQYTDSIISFLHMFGGVHVAPIDAVLFIRKLFYSHELTENVDKEQVEESKQKLMNMRPLCRDLVNMVRTRGTLTDCVEDMRQMVLQSGLSGDKLTEELTSPFGYTVLQLAATLSLANVCTYLINECHMSPLFVPAGHSDESTSNATTTRARSDDEDSEQKWLLSPFRLAVRTLNIEVITAFLACDYNSFNIHDMLDHKELPIADPFQRTAIQELLSKPTDTLSDEAIGSIVTVLRLLLRHGVSVQGNFDALGNDAWMMAVCSSPGKGIALQVFLEEHVELGEEDIASETGESFTQPAFSDGNRDEEEEEEDEEREQHPQTECSSEADGGKSEDFLTEPSASMVSETATMNSSLSLVLTMRRKPGEALASFGYVRRRVGRRRGQRSSEYYASLIFACAENNPQLLAKFITEYPHVLSTDVINSKTGETLLMYLLRRASDLYVLECGLRNLFLWEGKTDAPTPSPDSAGALLYDTPQTHPTVESGSTPYRDPLTIPGVRILLGVVDQLLRTFSFNNLHYECNGQTALTLAARLSCNPAVRHIVIQGCQQAGSDTTTVVLSSPSKSSTKVLGWGTLSGGDRSPARMSSPCNEGLQNELRIFNCWMSLCNCLYYTEEDMEALFAVLRHLPSSIRVSFMGMVYPNLHPMVALRVAVLYTNAMKRILIKPMVSSTFWCSVFYAQFVGRLEEEVLRNGKWNTLLSILLPCASAIPIYLLKSMPSFPETSPDDLLPGTSLASVTPTEQSTERIARGSVLQQPSNWRTIINGTEQYIKQIATAAVCAVAPVHLTSGTQSYKNLPAVRQSFLSEMASHFHEVLELAVRFDNCALLSALINMLPADLCHCLKFEWRCLMEKNHLPVIAVTAGSVNVLKYLERIPEAGRYVTYDRYDRIDTDTGMPDDYAANEHNAQQDATQPRRRSISLPSIAFLGSNERPQNTLSPHKGLDKAGDASPSEKQSEGGQLKGSNSGTAAGNSQEAGDTTKEGTLHSWDVISAVHQRKAVGAVTWGVGAAARPVSMHKQSVSKESSNTTMKLSRGRQHGGAMRRRSAGTGKSFNVTPASSAPDSWRSGADGKPKSSPSKRRLSLEGGPGTGGTSFTSPSRGMRLFSITPEVREQPRYFAYYLCDWALHTTLLLHAPYPSMRMIETLLHLMDNRAPLSASAIHMFLAASRPMNHWSSGEGEHITLNYTTPTHGDTILHLLVQNHQIQLARYFLAAAHCFFACYQYDQPSTVPPNFPVSSERGTCGDTVDSDSRYPAVFLRSMLRTNKHGLTAFDYARGMMVSVLQEYGCVPPTYRPNPREFCHTVRLVDGMSTFQRVPQLLLVSPDFVKLRDNVRTNPKQQDPSVKPVITDATIQRNQAAALRITRSHILTTILADDVSLLHLGLCAADDELVLENIERRRRKRAAELYHPAAASGRSMSSPRGPSIRDQQGGNQRLTRLPHIGGAGETAARTSTPASGGRKVDKEMHSMMKLIDSLQKRGLVVFPLLLPATEDDKKRTAAIHSNDGLALQLAMTPMTVALQQGAVKLEVATVTSPNPTQQQQQQHRSPVSATEPLDSMYNNDVQDATISPRSLQPYTFPPKDTPRQHPANMLEAWLASSKMQKGVHTKVSQELHQNTQAIITVMEKGNCSRSAKQIGLTVSMPYEIRNEQSTTKESFRK